MQSINCINLCEILPSLQNTSSIRRILSEAMKIAQFTTCERIYMGSSFCGKFFLHQKQETVMSLFGLCRDKGINVTLVVPTFSEGDLASGKHRLKQIVQWGRDCVDEITVNDYGMLLYIKDTFPHTINMGRLFMKDYRDPRYEEYFQMPWKPKMFTSYVNGLIREYKISSIEFDITHRNMDFSEVPDAILPGLHTPYCYQTVGRICEYASIQKDINKKFRVNQDCNENCLENLIRYHVTDENVEYIRKGRTVYVRNPGYELTGLNKYRLIYFPITLS